jgi:hypothetical protein
MAYVEWSMQGAEYVHCNCDVGCPCQFNALPSHGHCRAFAFVHVERGRFGETPLDGLDWGILAAWPGAIHHGDGTFMAVVDEGADPRQRAALEAVAHGRETDPGSLVWQIFSTTVTRLLPTRYAPIQLEVDVDRARGRVRVPGLIEGGADPIGSVGGGTPHRARIVLPAGMEFSEAEVALGRARAQGPIALEFDDTHAHLARIHWSTHGVVR